MKKVIIGCKSVFTYMKYKILYGSRIQMAKINSLKGRIEIDLFSDAKCRIGNFLMTAGPFYIKCTDKAEITIGDNCFFNHNCSLTAAENIVIGNQCMFANNFVVVDHDHDRKDGKILKELVSAPVKIGNNVWCIKRGYDRGWCGHSCRLCCKQRCSCLFRCCRSSGTKN
mgnify:CR=1 FL=1